MSAAGASGVERLWPVLRDHRLIEGSGGRGADCACGGWKAQVRSQLRVEHRAHVAAALAPEVAAMQAEAVREALEGAAEAIEWRPPADGPCEHAEACCGSAAYCDAVRPITRVVGADWLRDRAAALAAQTSRDPREGSQGAHGAAGGRVVVAEGGEGS